MAMIESNSRARILVAGCGALGGDIALRLSSESDVWGLRRNASRIPAGVQPVSADLLDRPALAEAVPGQPDIILYCLTPSSYDDEGYRKAYVEGLQNLLAVTDTRRLKRLLFISSTSVYGQDDDSEIDESSIASPRKFSGQRVLEGEQVALTSGLPATVLRLSGIYGPSRRRFLDAVRAGAMNPASPGPFSNRIHEEDAARACVHLISQALAGNTLENCYLVTDSEPARLDQVVAWVRQQTPCHGPLSDARTGGRAGSKRCSNRRLLASGFELKYPDYRTGYGEMIR
ncbi:NAD-dependent epimerase/dehydratase family protein, partial [uncultured Marinobacter sp.]|uniref:NAD-dependent epimerase/dehydratase family protein n=1 Tax=uncultured Marinobacter sp. TaxID=187379 RepID=UPI0030DA645D